MPGVAPRYPDGGPVTREVVEAVAGGQLVEARAGSKVGVAAAGSLKCLGVATKDAVPAGTSQDGASTQFGVIINTSPVSEFVAVGRGFYPVKYAAIAAFGETLICAANGQVTPAGATPDARTIIGRCEEPAGVAAGAVGLAYITA